MYIHPKFILLLILITVVTVTEPRHVLQQDDLRLEELLGVLRHGLKYNEDQPTVGIVGCGVAGLLALKLLTDAGYQAECLEANTMPGGRTNTFQFNSFGLWVDMGAMRFPCAHWGTLSLINMLNLTLSPFQSTNPEGLFYFTQTTDTNNHVRPLPRRLFNYKDNTTYSPAAVADLCKHYNVTRENEKVYSEELFDNMIRPQIELLEKDVNNWEKLALELDKYSTRQYLQAKGWSDEAIMMWAVTQNQESYLDLSFLEYFRDYAGMWWEDTCKCSYPTNDPEKLYTGIPREGLWEIDGGASTLTNKLYKQYQDHVRFGTIVTQIEQGGDVKVTYRKHDFTTESRMYDYVFLSVPLTSIRHINILPKLSFSLEAVIREAHYVEVVKIAIMYRKRWWEDPNPLVAKSYNHQGIIGGGSTITDTDIRTIYYPSNPDNSSTRAVVLVYVWGEEAKRWSALSTENREQLAASRVNEISGGVADQYFEFAVSMDWNTQPFHGGAFHEEKPGDHRRFHASLNKWEGRIRLVGEAIGFAHSWIQGAIYSTVQALQEFQTDIVSKHPVHKSKANTHAPSFVPHPPLDELESESFPTNNDYKFVQDSTTGVNRTVLCMVKLMRAIIDIPPYAIASNHSHTSEQWGIVLAGAVRVTIGNETKTLYPTMQYHVPSNVHHSVVGLSHNSKVEEYFSPPRDPCDNPTPQQVFSPVHSPTTKTTTPTTIPSHILSIVLVVGGLLVGVIILLGVLLVRKRNQYYKL